MDGMELFLMVGLRELMKFFNKCLNGRCWVKQGSPRPLGQ